MKAPKELTVDGKVEMDAEISKTRCAACAKITTRICSACADFPIIPDCKLPQVYYCSEICRVADFKVHKDNRELLQSRRTPYHAGEIPQGVFYKVRTMIFDKAIATIERHDIDGERCIIVHEGTRSKIVTPFDCLVPFPADMCDSEEERHALLFMMASQYACAWFDEPVDFVLEEIASKLEEPMMELTDNTNLRISVLRQDGTQVGPSFSHCVFLVPLNQGEKYALEFSGAQFGFKDIVTPWETYCDQYVKQFHTLNGFPIGQATLGTTRKNVDRQKYRQVEHCWYASRD